MPVFDNSCIYAQVSACINDTSSDGDSIKFCIFINNISIADKTSGMSMLNSSERCFLNKRRRRLAVFQLFIGRRCVLAKRPRANCINGK